MPCPPVLTKKFTLHSSTSDFFSRQSFSVPSSEIIKTDSIMFSSQEKKNCDSFLLPNEENDDGRVKNSFLSERGEREGDVNWGGRRLFFKEELQK